MIPATVYGAETFEATAEVCRDCNTPRGGSHHYGCCDEECPHRQQAITCELCPVLEHDPYFVKLGRAN